MNTNGHLRPFSTWTPVVSVSCHWQEQEQEQEQKEEKEEEEAGRHKGKDLEEYQTVQESERGRRLTSKKRKEGREKRSVTEREGREEKTHQTEINTAPAPAPTQHRQQHQQS
jgi:hypothetical protein